MCESLGSPPPAAASYITTPSTSTVVPIYRQLWFMSPLLTYSFDSVNVETHTFAERRPHSARLAEQLHQDFRNTCHTVMLEYLISEQAQHTFETMRNLRSASRRQVIFRSKLLSKFHCCCSRTPARTHSTADMSLSVTTLSMVQEERSRCCKNMTRLHAILPAH